MYPISPREDNQLRLHFAFGMITSVLTEIQISFLAISGFAALLAIIVKIIQHREVFDKPNVSSRILLCLAVSGTLLNQIIFDM